MYQKRIFDNGLTVVLEAIPHVRSVSIGFWVKAGSIYEEGKMNGASHFIEHLLFKGTGKRDAQEIAATLDRVGGQLNAFSSKEYTCFYAKVIDQHTDLAIELLTDLLRNSVFNEKEIKREKKVVLEEIKMYDDTPDELIHEMFSQELWKNSSWGQPILGSRKNIENMSREDLVSFYQKFYTPDNIIVSVAGNIDPDSIMSAVEESFHDLKGSVEHPEITEPVTKSGILVKTKDIEQVHMCLGIPGLKKLDDDKYALTVLSIAMGGGMSSRLFQEIREKRGLVYTIYSYQTDYRDAGFFTVYAGFSKKNLKTLLKLVIDEFENVKARGFTEDELLRAREQLKGSLILGLESTSNRMSRMARLEIYLKNNQSIDDLIKQIDSIGNDDIIRVMDRLYDREKLLLTAIGPVERKDISF
ncbi:MAG: peptidase M16 [Candidatus Wallbacteria bacterium HGW-Wallbacteria-1]|jgi:predicted Zn-dependent peptidase|uniref:Peptidase M16 n=1 Tax=Candidatus Wallbacteria bacterium HGW-Wallbacteria-1 TaxID=2013854 RepID=A0A2N1PQE9_9BACT|nr:MAG: peptidase M16 [Candidatus Wallbacteria bacterium HGW-Wallbacteria-1]